MPKAEKGSVKDIAKRIKAKGLQKLKFWCEMCQKQCRDANGFKCHLTSESHLRQMKIFSENAGGIMDRKSKEFEKTFLDTLRMRHSTAKTNANNVYQEVIQEKSHVHMNATIWATLSDFVKYLGKTGKCLVEETERGWYVTYIERDVQKLAKQEANLQRLEAEQAAEEALSELMERQRVEAAKALDRIGATNLIEPTRFERENPKATIQVALNTNHVNKKTVVTTNSIFGQDDDEEEEGPPTIPTPEFPVAETKKRAFIEKETTIETKRYKQSEPWITKDILVRIIDKKRLGGKLFRRKAAIDRVIDNYTAHVTVLDSGPDIQDGGETLTLHQDALETVVPKQTGKKVRILKGMHRGKEAVVLDLNNKKYCAALELNDGTVVERVDYGYFSKLAT